MSGKGLEISVGRERNDRLLRESNHDPYMRRSKPSNPTVCPNCEVVFHAGRWQWVSEVPEGAAQQLCPACQRVRDRVPAGYLILSGAFFQEHQEEIVNLLHNKVNQQKSHHPMKRIMGVEFQDDGSAVITFTDIHLPRGVGEAIASAYNGELDIHYTEQPGQMRVYWQREE